MLDVHFLEVLIATLHGIYGCPRLANFLLFRDGSCHPSPEEGRGIDLRVAHEAQEGQACSQSCRLL